jgi:hypothetical protein
MAARRRSLPSRRLSLSSSVEQHLRSTQQMVSQSPGRAPSQSDVQAMATQMLIDQLGYDPRVAIETSQREIDAKRGEMRAMLAQVPPEIRQELRAKYANDPDTLADLDAADAAASQPPAAT